MTWGPTTYDRCVAWGQSRGTEPPPGQWVSEPTHLAGVRVRVWPREHEGQEDQCVLPQPVATAPLGLPGEL